jgi:hypothetical protein
MKLATYFPTLLLTLTLASLGPVSSEAAESFTDTMAKARATYRADREVFLAESMQLTESESAAFWPLYRSYRADMDALGDELVKLVLEYVDVYPNVPEDRAEQLLEGYTKLESKLAKKREWYWKRARKALPAAKVLRWAQLEGRMDLVLRVQLASAIPLMPGTPSKQ